MIADEDIIQGQFSLQPGMDRFDSFARLSASADVGLIRNDQREKTFLL